MTNPDTPDETAADRRERYERVVSCVGHNTLTDGEAPPGCRRSQVLVSLTAHADYEPAGVKRSLRAAVEQGDVLAWTDTAGADRYTDATEEEPLLALTNYVVAVGHPEKQRIVARANQIRQELSDR